MRASIASDELLAVLQEAPCCLALANTDEKSRTKCFPQNIRRERWAMSSCQVAWSKYQSATRDKLWWSFDILQDNVSWECDDIALFEYGALIVRRMEKRERARESGWWGGGGRS
jgi:hypothetical protein